MQSLSPIFSRLADSIFALVTELRSQSEFNNARLTAQQNRLDVVYKVLIEGDDETPSLREQVRSNNRALENLSRIGWIIIGAVITNIVVLIFTLAQRGVSP